MNTSRKRIGIFVAMVFALLWVTTNGIAQTFYLLAGTVLDLRNEVALSSDTSRVGDTFTNTVTKSVYMDGAIAVPENSTVRARIMTVTPARRQEPGILGVVFDQMTVNGRTYAIDGTLTSVDPTEREQILEQEGKLQGGSSTKRDVVFIGGGAGAGAVVGAIAGGGKGAGIGALAGGALGALGAFLSPGKEAKVDAGTNIAMELQSPVTLTGNQIGRQRNNNDRSVYTATSVVRSAQSALKQRNYYAGAVNGQLDAPTRRAVAHFQIDNGQPATGDLDENTVASLGLATNRTGSSYDSRQTVLDVSQKARSLLTRYENSLGVRVTNLTNAARLSEADLNLLLELNSFVTAVSWYEQASLQNNFNQSVPDSVSRVVARIARNVEQSMQTVSGNRQLRDTWADIRSDLRLLRLDSQISSRF